MGLRSKTVKGIGIVGALQAFRWVLSIGSSIILYRLLQARDFGLFSLCETYLMFAAIFSEMGLEETVIQKKEKDLKKLLSSGFWVRLICSSISFVILFGGARFFADWIQDPDFEKPLRVMALTLLVNLTFFKSEVAIKKKLEFSKLATPEVSTALCSAFLSIGLAWVGFGYWSLVISTVIGQLLRSFLLNRIEVHPLWGKGNADLMRELVNKGKHIFSITLLYTALNRLGHFVVGNTLGLVSLGYYHLAFNWSNVFVSRIVRVTNQVVFPAASTVSTEPSRLKKIYHEYLKHISLVGAPFNASLVIFAPFLIVTALGEKWEPAIFPFQIMCLYGYFRTMATPGFTLLHSMGEFKVSNILLMAELVLLLGLVYPLVQAYGIIGVALSMILSKGFSILLVTWKMADLLKEPVERAFRTVAPSFFSAVGMMLMMFFVSKGVSDLEGMAFLQGSVVVLAGIVSYPGLFMLLNPKGKSDLKILIQDMKSIFRR